ncbi:GNAT family N-acetyltransferase [Pacificispira sp.]|uniref:GNAT family N-acetyltransferase n=1 Tax=Pacificispira sp. TaxID=2888761 RepID=UPI003B51FB07
MQYSLTQEVPTDSDDIDALIDSAFGPGRLTRTVHRFRKSVPPMKEYGFVARLEGEMVASIRFWPVVLPCGTIIPMLGPLAVRPEIRGLGIGRALVRKGMDTVRVSGMPAIVIVGDPGYYAPFGFSVEPVQGLDLGGPVVPLTLMGIEYEAGALSGKSGTVEPVPT